MSVIQCVPFSVQLLSDTTAMGDLLARRLAEHEITFERQRDLFLVSGKHNPARVVDLLRQTLSPPERDAIAVRRTGNRKCLTLDNWWLAHETTWFDAALANSQFETWFQPIIDTGFENKAEHGGGWQKLLGHECLIRLRAGSLQSARVYSGGEIVEAAASRGETHAFDAMARRLAIRSAARQGSPERYFINFDPWSIYDPEACFESTFAAIENFGFNPGDIVFEAVKTYQTHDYRHLQKICDFCRSNGFAFALDDFGTAVNSGDLVRDLRPDYIKLDRSLVERVEHPVVGATIRRVVELAERFGSTLIAVGVERPVTVENLWLLGVEVMQGYLFGRPSPSVLHTEPASLLLAEHDPAPVLAYLDQQFASGG